MRMPYLVLLTCSLWWVQGAALPAQEAKDSQAPKTDQPTPSVEDLERQAQEASQRAKELAKQAQDQARHAHELMNQAREARREGRRTERREDRGRTIDQASTMLDDKDLGGGAFKAGTITGTDIRNSKGEDLGSIEELVVDVNTGQIRYAAVSFGGFLGIGDKLFAVPWNALKLHKGSGDEEDFFVLNIDKERLRDAPGFSQDNWPSFGNEQLVRDLEKFYGTETPRAAEKRRDIRRE